MNERYNYNLLGHNTFGIDVNCRKFVEYQTVEEAQTVARQLTADATPFLILGGGSNLLLTGDFEGTVVHSAIKGLDVLTDTDA